MRDHLLRPDKVDPPPEYQEFVVERRFWLEFGVGQPPLSQWPHRKVTRYTQIMQVETEIAAQRRREADETQVTGRPGGGPSAAVKAQATEDAFQRMRETALAEAAAAKQPPPSTT